MEAVVVDICEECIQTAGCSPWPSGQRLTTEQVQVCIRLELCTIRGSGGVMYVYVKDFGWWSYMYVKDFG